VITSLEIGVCGGAQLEDVIHELEETCPRNRYRIRGDAGEACLLHTRILLEKENIMLALFQQPVLVGNALAVPLYPTHLNHGHL
jgi:hypothetical protein